MAACTDADLRYIRENFAPLEELCAGRPGSVADVRTLIAAGRMPKASYVLDDGTEMFPRDYFRLLDAAGGLERLSEDFLARYSAAGRRRVADEAAAAWRAYLEGTYGCCLREVTPEAIARKAELVSSLCELIVLAQPADPGWRRALRERVEELEELERDFAPDFDRNPARGRPPTRDLLATAARERYPEAFAPRKRAAGA